METGLRIETHPALGSTERKMVQFTFDGRPIWGVEGEPIAVALWAAGIRDLGFDEMRGHYRGLFCGIGHCQGCRVTVDGVPNVRACLTPLRAGMQVTTQRHDLAWQPTRVWAKKVDVAIVGAGPAGLAASVETARRGLTTIVLDEQPWPGGRMPSQVHADPRRNGGWVNGAATIEVLVRQAQEAGVEFVLESEVWSVWPGWAVVTCAPGSGLTGIFEARAVLLATGAAHKGLPFPGWSLPGVITAGAAQAMMHRHRVLPGRRVLVVGVDPLVLSVAQELQLVGADVVGVVLPAPGPEVGPMADPRHAVAAVSRLAGLARSRLVRFVGPSVKKFSPLAARLYPPRGLRMEGIPLMLRRCLLEVRGDAQVREAILAGLSADGCVVPYSQRAVDVDTVCISGGLYPLAELAGVSGLCRFAHVEELGGWVPLHGSDMRTTAGGLFVAGSVTGVEGAEVAMAQGRLAGLGMAAYLGCLSAREAGELLAGAAKGVRDARRSALLSFHPDVEKGRARVAELWMRWGNGEGKGPSAVE